LSAVCFWFTSFPSGSENCLQPLLEARDFLQRLAVEELAVATSAEKVRHPLRGPLLARMEMLRQLFHNDMHRISLELGKEEWRMCCGAWVVLGRRSLGRY